MTEEKLAKKQHILAYQKARCTKIGFDIEHTEYINCVLALDKARIQAKGEHDAASSAVILPALLPQTQKLSKIIVFPD